jgi:predicted  nucleic acid-binding Zn-ribbon protein
MQMQEAVLQEIRSRVNILQAQDDQIVEEANSIFEDHKNELEAIPKRVTNCDSQILNTKGTKIGIQRSLKDMNSKIIKVTETLESIRNSLKEVPSKRELREHAAATEDQLAQSRELNTDLTTAMEGYKFSESTPYDFRGPGLQAGPSTTVHPERQHYFGSDASSLSDTESQGIPKAQGRSF